MKRIVLAVAACAVCAGFAGVKLAEDGKALAQIVIADKATQSAQFGAKDLQWHLRKMTGGEFEIVRESQAKEGVKILVGPSKFTATDLKTLSGQQYVVDVRSNAVELVGLDKQQFAAVSFEAKPEGIYYRNKPDAYDRQGTMYAVYEFLETFLGVEWVDAYDYGTLVPERKTIELREERRTFEPFMAYRGGTIDHYPQAVMWKRGTKERNEFNALAFKDPKNKMNAYRLFLARQRVGGDLAPANHSFYWWYDRFWTEKCPRFERKWTEAFAQGYAGEPPQLCYSNPDVVKQTVEDVRKYFDNGGYDKPYRSISRKGAIWGEKRYCLEPMDNTSFCKCERCAKQYEPGRAEDKSEHSTYWFTFVKAVADEIAKSHPDCVISTLAYYSHEGLPKNVTLPANVEVYFCISGNREDPRGELARKQMARMKEWHEAYPKMRLGLWLYNAFPLEFAHNGGFECVPGYFAREADKQYKFFKETGARTGIFHCGMTGEVCQYLSWHWMRNPDADVEMLLASYFSQYGAAAKPMRAFYDLVEERYCSERYRPQGVSIRSTESFWKHRCPPEIMAKLQEYMDEARRLADSPEVKARLDIFEAGTWKWMKRGADSYAERMASPLPVWKAGRIASAKGEIGKVDWTAISEIPVDAYQRGSDVKRPDVMGVKLKLAHDGEWLYMELVQVRDLEDLHISGKIVAFDDWEIVMARQPSQPYRCYLMDPDNRIEGLSWGEINWRQGVSSRESHGDKAYFAKVKSELVKPDRWVQRLAFPLDKFLDGPVKPGDTFRMTPVSVLNKKAGKEKQSACAIFSLVSYSTVHTIDRSATVVLEK